MLPKTNRITRADDYKRVVRRGSRFAGQSILTYLHRREEGQATRFGFIVAKNVGPAVTRNRVRRRLKAASYELLPSISTGWDVVVRALPASASASWDSLRGELTRSVIKGTTR